MTNAGSNGEQPEQSSPSQVPPRLVNYHEIVSRYEVCVVAFSPDGHHLAAATSDHVITVYSLEQGWEEVKSMRHWVKTLALTFSPRGDFLAAGGDDRAVLVYDALRDWELVASLGARYLSRAIAFSPCGLYLASGVRPRTVRIFTVAGSGHVEQPEDAETRELFNQVTDTWPTEATITHTGVAFGLTFNRGGKYLFLTSSPDEVASTHVQVTVYDVLGGWTAVRIFSRQDGITAIAFCSSQDYVLVSGTKARSMMKIRDDWPLNETVDVLLKDGPVTPNGAAFSPNGAYLALSDRDTSSLVVYDGREKWRSVDTLYSSTPIRSLSFSSDSSYLAAGAGNVITIYQVFDGLSTDEDPRKPSVTSASRLGAVDDSLGTMDASLMMPRDDKEKVMAIRTTPPAETLSTGFATVLSEAVLTL